MPIQRTSLLKHLPRGNRQALQHVLEVSVGFYPVLAFHLFEVFVRLHSQLWRQGTVTLQELHRRLDRGLEHPKNFSPSGVGEPGGPGRLPQAQLFDIPASFTWYPQVRGCRPSGR
jgi:hypothetical protein